jgi:hypothetical protein
MLLLVGFKFSPTISTYAYYNNCHDISFYKIVVYVHNLFLGGSNFNSMLNPPHAELKKDISSFEKDKTNLRFNLRAH